MELSDALAVDRWSVDDFSNPRNAEITLLFSKPGRFRVNVAGGRAEGLAAVYGEGTWTRVISGDRKELHVPLERVRAGDSKSWEVSVTFYSGGYFAEQSVDVRWISEPVREEYDGNHVYRQLPPPSPPSEKR
jgi:hypothetical protein